MSVARPSTRKSSSTPKTCRARPRFAHYCVHCAAVELDRELLLSGPSAHHRRSGHDLHCADEGMTRPNKRGHGSIPRRCGAVAARRGRPAIGSHAARCSAVIRSTAGSLLCSSSPAARERTRLGTSPALGRHQDAANSRSGWRLRRIILPRLAVLFRLKVDPKKARGIIVEDITLLVTC